MNEIQLVSATYKVTRIVKKTRAKLFADIREGDLIRFKSALEYAGRSSRGCYASYITVENVTQGTSADKYISEATSTLRSCFEIEITEVGDEV